MQMRNPNCRPHLATFLNPEPFPRGVAFGVNLTESLNGEPAPLLSTLPIFPHNLCAAGVSSPPDTLGLLGNLGAGVRSTLPVRPSLAEVRFDCEIFSTMRWCRASRLLCS